METLSGLERRIHRLWWIPLITGIIGIGLGVWCFWSPATSLPVFAYVFAGILIVAGILNMEYAFVNNSLGTNWGWSLALGILELVCGVWLCTLPPLVIVPVFIYAVGIWVLVVAINAICEAASLPRAGAGWMVWMIIMLVATIFFAIYFLSSPIAGGIAGWIWLGLSLIFYGIYRIMLAFRIKSLNKFI